MLAPLSAPRVPSGGCALIYFNFDGKILIRIFPRRFRVFFLFF